MTLTRDILIVHILSQELISKTTTNSKSNITFGSEYKILFLTPYGADIY